MRHTTRVDAVSTDMGRFDVSLYPNYSNQGKSEVISHRPNKSVRRPLRCRSQGRP